MQLWKQPTLPAHRLLHAGSTKPHLNPAPQSESCWHTGFGLVQKAKSQHRQLESSISVQASFAGGGATGADLETGHARIAALLRARLRAA